MVNLATLWQHKRSGSFLFPALLFSGAKYVPQNSCKSWMLLLLHNSIQRVEISICFCISYLLLLWNLPHQNLMSRNNHLSLAHDSGTQQSGLGSAGLFFCCSCLDSHSPTTCQLVAQLGWCGSKINLLYRSGASASWLGQLTSLLHVISSLRWLGLAASSHDNLKAVFQGNESSSYKFLED